MQKASGELVKKLKKQKRENDFLLFLDNPKIIRDAIANGCKPTLALTCDQNFDESSLDCQVLLAPRSVIADLADVKTPQDVVVMTEYSQDMGKVPKNNFLVLDGLQDPGNVGTLVRSAVAAGFECVILIECTKITNPKVVRSSAGAIFSIPTQAMTRNEFVEFTKKHNLHLICTDMQGENVFDFQPKTPVGVVIGNEGSGVSDQIANLCEQTLSIPMSGKIESLNAAVSGSIIMFEISSKCAK